VKYCLSVVCFVCIINGSDLEGNMLIRMKLLQFCMFVLMCDLKKQVCEICSSNSTDCKECSLLGC